MLAPAAPQRIPDSPSEATRRLGSSLDSSLGEGFPDSLVSHLNKMSICRSFVPPSLPPSLHPLIIQQAPNKVWEVLGTRRNRSDSSPGSVLRELAAQLNKPSHY